MGDDENGFEADNEALEERRENGYIALFLCVLAFSLIVGHLLSHKWECKYIGEAGAILLIGTIFSFFITLNDERESTDASAGEAFLRGMSPAVFFIGFLPPIIFNSGYGINRKVFFYYFWHIFNYAVLGTFISSIVVGIGLFSLGQIKFSTEISLFEGLAFGSSISATDPVTVLAIFDALQVDPSMFYLVFGESVLNDAVSLILFGIFTEYIGSEFTAASCFKAFGDFILIFCGSMFIGFLFGCILALLLKYINLRHSIHEICVYFLVAYLPSLFASSISLSGVVTILFTGMFTKRYAHHNLTVEGQRIINFLFPFVAFMSESSVFLLLGMSVFTCDSSSFHLGFVFWTFVLILIGRGINVYSLSWLINKYAKNKVKVSTQHMLWFAGLRGAVAYACGRNFSDANNNRELIETTTVVIIFLTVFGFGTFTQSMLEYLRIPTGIPATDAVDLSSTGNKILEYEEKYLIPLVRRKPGSGSNNDHGQKGHGNKKNHNHSNNVRDSELDSSTNVLGILSRYTGMFGTSMRDINDDDAKMDNSGQNDEEIDDDKNNASRNNFRSGSITKKITSSISSLSPSLNKEGIEMQEQAYDRDNENIRLNLLHEGTNFMKNDYIDDLFVGGDSEETSSHDGEDDARRRMLAVSSPTSTNHVAQL